MSNQWNFEALNSRIKDKNKHLRYEAGSPNKQEIECYGRYINKGFQHQRVIQKMEVVVLGMTPELRQLAQRMGCQIICVDNNEEAIMLYKDWNLPEYCSNERILKADWMNLTKVLDTPVAAILGDGIFGNILSIRKYREMLRVLKESIQNKGFLVLRTIMIPRNFNISEYEAKSLMESFRDGKLTEADFGFGMRIFGSYDFAYEPQSFLLDNKMVFERYKDWTNRGLLSEKEYSLIQRYYFGGLNLIPPQDIWETMLAEEGFAFQSRPIVGRKWYEYYPIYYCFKIDHPHIDT